jgi:hypothetical protein
VVLEALRKGIPLGRRNRHRRLVVAAYQGLHQALSEYHDVQQDLTERHHHLVSESRKFYRSNDINSILDFIRGLTATDPSHRSLQSGPQQGQAERLADDLQLPLPPSPQDRIPEIDPPPPPERLKTALKYLASLGYKCLDI